MESGNNLIDVPRISLLEPEAEEQTVASGPTYSGASRWNTTTLNFLFRGLRKLREDHESGARELATRALSVLLDVARVTGLALATPLEREGRDDESWKRDIQICEERWKHAVRKCGWLLSRYGRPSLDAAITTAVVSALRITLNPSPEMRLEARGACGNMGPYPEPIKEGIWILQRQLSKRRGGTLRLIAAQLRDFLRERFVPRMSHPQGNCVIRILTLSNSSTIRTALGAMLEKEMEMEQHEPEVKRRPLRIILKILESRPLDEGVQMARELVKMAEKSRYTHMLQIEIGSDGSVAMLAKDADVLLLGADRISDSGDVSNKIGSLPAALCTKAVSNHGIVVVVSELEKVAKPGEMEEYGEENDVTELTDAWGSDKEMETEARQGSWRDMVTIRNVYFERVPAQYIHCYVCEDGTLDAEDIKKRSKLVLEAEKEMFSQFD
jgi:translation initiation factor 2B subunit (eIF-2B alpha/beta/delta family)